MSASPALVIPLLQINHPSATKKRSWKKGKRDYYTQKMGAGYKSRCSDLERWQQYSANEHRFANATTNFSCPYRFLSQEQEKKEPCLERAKHSSKVYDKIIVAGESINTLTLEQFTKKRDEKSLDEWETAIRQRLPKRAKVEGDDRKLKRQRSKLFMPSSNQIKQQEEQQNTTTSHYQNPLRAMIKNDEKANERLQSLVCQTSDLSPSKSRKKELSLSSNSTVDVEDPTTSKRKKLVKSFSFRKNRSSGSLKILTPEPISRPGSSSTSKKKKRTSFSALLTPSEGKVGNSPSPSSSTSPSRPVTASPTSPPEISTRTSKHTLSVPSTSRIGGTAKTETRRRSSSLAVPPSSLNIIRDPL